MSEIYDGAIEIRESLNEINSTLASIKDEIVKANAIARTRNDVLAGLLNWFEDGERLDRLVEALRND
jgi:hypothetical protein